MDEELYLTVLIDGVIHYQKYEPEEVTDETPSPAQRSSACQLWL